MKAKLDLLQKTINRNRLKRDILISEIQPGKGKILNGRLENFLKVKRCTKGEEKGEEKNFERIRLPFYLLEGKNKKVFFF